MISEYRVYENGVNRDMTPQEIAEMKKAQQEYEQSLEYKQFQIQQLKDELQNTDYKVIKCYEAQLLNIEMPYDINNLINERQIKRDLINHLEMEVLDNAN